MSTSQPAVLSSLWAEPRRRALEGFGQLGPETPSDLRRIKLFEDLSEAELARLAERLTYKKVSSGDFYNAEDLGEPGVSFVWRGQCRVIILSPGGEHATLRIVRPGWHFGEINLLSKTIKISSQLAFDQETNLLRLSAIDFEMLMRSIPGLMRNVLGHVAETAIAQAERIYEFSILDSRLRLQAALLRLSQYGLRHGNVVTIIHAPTHEELAAQVGMTREGVTRHMRSFAQQGLVLSKRCAITILDVSRLAANLEKAAGQYLSHPFSSDVCA